MTRLLARLEHERKQTLPGGHVLRPLDEGTRGRIVQFLGAPVSPEYFDLLDEYGGTTIYSVPLPCPKSSSADRLRELPYDVGNLYLIGNYTPNAKGELHTRSVDIFLKYSRPYTPAGMLPIGDHVEPNVVYYSHRPESYGRIFLYCEEDLPNFDAYDPANRGKSPPDPFLACQEVAPNLETLFKGLRSFSDEEYDEWLDRANSYI